MVEVINLRRARKAKARSANEAKAAANRLAHGRTKAEKQVTKAEQEAAARKLDGHKHDGSRIGEPGPGKQVSDGE
jgi:hypothetical protein